METATLDLGIAIVTGALIVCSISVLTVQLARQLVDTILSWREWKSAKKQRPVSRGLMIYNRLAYAWWVIAYIADGLMSPFEVG